MGTRSANRICRFCPTTLRGAHFDQEKIPTHPGETIRIDCIEASNLTVTEAARLLGCSRAALSRVLNGQASITREMAIAFEREGWSNADFWMRRQAAYNLAQTRGKLAIN